MDRLPVDSSQIKNVGYDEENKILEIEFKSGGIYQYKPIGKRLYNAFMMAKSHGKYFHENIRHNKDITTNKIS